MAVDPPRHVTEGKGIAMSEDVIVNHHADHPGFAGPMGLLIAVALLFMGRTNARRAVDLAGVTAADHVVDVGCGAGGAVRAAVRRGARATGVDPASVMLRVARWTTPRGRPVTWLRGGAEELSVPDGAATVVWSIATVHHWQDVPAGLREAHRVLAPGGRLLAIERWVAEGATGFASHGWTAPQAQAFAELCRAAGFADVAVASHGEGRSGVWSVLGVRS